LKGSGAVNRSLLENFAHLDEKKEDLTASTQSNSKKSYNDKFCDPSLNMERESILNSLKAEASSNLIDKI